MCLYPKYIKNRKYLKNKKNGGNIPPVPDERVKWVPVGCQNCIECRKQKARTWQVRLLEDIKQHKNGKFITLTFSNDSIRQISQTIETLEGYDLDNEIATKGMRLFLERHRKHYGTSIRHFVVTELGHKGTENIHLHGILWTDLTREKIQELWNYGYTWPRAKSKIKTWVNNQTINYMIKYINKIDNQHKYFKSKILTSPGIGGNYMQRADAKQNKYNGTETQETYRTSTGHKINLPIYFRNKIYTEQEREKLWLQKLDKQERWIMGEKIDISKGDEQYYKQLKWYRIKNKQLGYGNDEKNWNREVYERERRKLLQAARITPPNPPQGGEKKDYNKKKKNKNNNKNKSPK